MKSWLRENKIVAAALFIGLICTLILCGTRAGMEAGDTGVSIIMTRGDIAALAASAGISYGEYAETLTDAGLSAIFTPGEINKELNLYIGDSYHGERAVVGLLEDSGQYSFIPIEGFEYSENTAVVRVFKLIPQYAARYSVLGYSGAQEIENLVYRSITDRNIRVVWLCPFIDSATGAMISNPDDYASVIHGIGTRIEKHGLQLGDFSVIGGYTPNQLLILGVAAGIAAAGVILLGSVIRLPHRLNNVLLAVSFSAGFAALKISPSIIPLAASVIYSCLGAWLMTSLIMRVRDGTPAQLLLSYAAILSAGFAVALIGAHTVGAMQSSRAYLLAVSNFRGVKLSQILPLIFAAYIGFKILFKGMGAREVLREYRGSLPVAIAAIALMSLAGVIYIVRTGDGILPVGVTEQRFRNLLENLLIVRPRTKEFLVAWPSAAFAVVLMARKKRHYALPFAIFSSVGLASLINTFCHSRSPLWLSLTRSGLGLIAGCALGAIIILLFAKRRKAS